MSRPVIDDQMLETVAANAGVCARPVIRVVTDTQTGEEHQVVMPCGSTRERVCPPCADKTRRIRMQQCRDGWHTTAEPVPTVDDADDSGSDDIGSETVESAEDGDADEGVSSGRVGRRRSTKRLAGFPELPKVPPDEREDRTIGAELTSPSGKTYRPSTFLTLTLPSYGPVRDDGTPVNPDSYDYRRAAVDAMHFPKLVDRFWQNLRRCAGYQVQYFATIEAQKRLALHLHAAIRGVISNRKDDDGTIIRVVEQTVAATYKQLWWPAFDTPIYTTRHPVWAGETHGFVDPDSGAPLPDWDTARDETTEPAALLYFGSQVDKQWFIPGTKRSEKRIGYLVKYLTKSIAEAYDPDTTSARQKAHRDRLAAQTRWLPCSPDCANWLRFGVQPKNPHYRMRPGHCSKPAHDPDNLGHGGQRCLVSGQWSGKTIQQHRADRAEVIKTALAEAGIEMPDQRRFAADQTGDDGQPRYEWRPSGINADTDPKAYRELIQTAISERITWNNQYQAAKQQAALAAEQQHRAARKRPPERHSATAGACPTGCVSDVARL